MQQKVFRVEAMLARRRPGLAPVPAPQKPVNDEIARLMRDLEAVFAVIDRSKHELAALRSEAETPRLPRAARELGAAIVGMEAATEKILKAAEGADESARNLVATLKDDYKRGLAHDVQENVVAIYEACNFQDLAGQRINKAMAAIETVERGLTRVVEIWGGLEQFRRHAAKPPAKDRLLNGPKLEDDAGHAEQSDIDRIFG